MPAKCYLSVLLLLLCGAASAQKQTRAEFYRSWPRELKGYQAVYYSFLGPGCFNSLNYELRFHPDRLGLGVRVGIGNTISYWEDDMPDSTGKVNSSHNTTKLTVPLGINYLFGRAARPHRLELGLGITYVHGDAVIFDEHTTRYAWLLNLTVAYRRYSFKNRLNWKLGITPMMSTTRYGGYPLPWAEGSIGFNF